MTSSFQYLSNGQHEPPPLHEQQPHCVPGCCVPSTNIAGSRTETSTSSQSADRTSHTHPRASSISVRRAANSWEQSPVGSIARSLAASAGSIRSRNSLHAQSSSMGPISNVGPNTPRSTRQFAHDNGRLHMRDSRSHVVPGTIFTRSRSRHSVSSQMRFRSPSSAVGTLGLPELHHGPAVTQHRGL